MKQPGLGWVTPAHIEKEYDGDSLTVSVKRVLTIRLVDDEIYYDTPETGWRAKTDEERLHAADANAYLHHLLYNSDGTEKNIVIYIPTDGSGVFKDTLVIGGRFKTQIWADGVDVVDEMIKAGFLKKDEYKDE